jgi:hypothetical protein
LPPKNEFGGRLRGLGDGIINQLIMEVDDDAGNAKLDAELGFLYRLRPMSQKPRSVTRSAQANAAENLERLKASRPLRPPAAAQFVERASTAGAQELRAFLLRSGRIAPRE